jgi:hypothetical protein
LWEDDDFLESPVTNDTKGASERSCSYASLSPASLNEGAKMPKLWIRTSEYQRLVNSANELNLARREVSDLKVAKATEKKRYDAALKAIQAEKARGDGHKSSLREVDRLILEEAETSRDFRSGFSKTILQIRHSETGQGLKSQKLVSALLEEFKNDRNTFVFLDTLHSDLVAWAQQYYGQERGQVYHEIGARIQNFRRGKINDVQNLREQITGWKNGFEIAREETRNQQAIGEGLVLEMQRLKEAHEQSIAQLIGDHELQKDIHIGDVAKIKRDHENGLALLNRKIVSLKGEHEEATARTRRDYDEEKDRLDKTIKELQNELDQHKEELQNTVTNLQASHASELQHQAEDHEFKEEEMVRKLGETKRKHNQAMQSLEAEHDLLLQNEMEIHSLTIATMKQDHEEERSKWQRDLVNEKEIHTVEKNQLTSEYNQQRTLMEEDHANQTRLNREASDKEVADMKEALESQKALFTGRVENIKEEYKSQLEKLIAERDGLEDRHATELRKLRGSFEHEIEAYCEALLARDKFTPIPDPEITSRFTALTQEVHALSLLEWKADRKKWSTQVLHQLSDNERSLKQQILKDIIWRALQEYIFCSPFRILGEEGKVLEKQWNDACGQGLLHALSGQLPLLEAR